MNIKLLKVFLSIILMFCIFDMPFGYYQFVKFAAMIGFAYLTFLAEIQNMNSINKCES